MKKRHLGICRFLVWTLIMAVIFAGCPNLFGKDMVSVAQEKHMVKAQQEQSEAAWQTQEGEWEFGTLAEAVENVTPQGQVVLLSDVTLTSGITISKTMTIVSNEEGNPCTIRNMEQETNDNKDGGRIFTVTGGTVGLQNIILDGGSKEGVTGYHPLICVSGASAYLGMLDGTVLQNAVNEAQGLCGGGINIRRGRVYMGAGSRITNCKARHGGGIEVNSNAHYSQAMLGMAGGSIDGCQADDGGGVYVNIGVFQMQGGEIKGNRATREDGGGGGIYVAGGGSTSKVAAVRVDDGKITDNEALSNGGGIMVEGGAAQTEMYGGIVERNTAQTGGGISMIWGTLKLYGGTVTNNRASLYGGGVLGCLYSVIKLQGNPRVFENTAGDTEDRFDDLYLDGQEDAEGSAVTRQIQLTGPLTEGVRLGMSLWIRPDEHENPYREMIVPGDGYEISQEDFNQLCGDIQNNNKGLYTNNTEKYALIPYEGKIVMVLPVDIALDRQRIYFDKAGDTTSLVSTVTPDSAPLKEVTWSSSDENVATVDADGRVTAVGEGKAMITATTVSPYHKTASCKVTVGKFYFGLTTRAEHGEIFYDASSADAEGRLEENQQVTLKVEPDKGYQLRDGSLRACQTDDETVPVTITGDVFDMPDFDVTVTADFEPISYAITCHLEGGTLEEGETNPDCYTIEDSEITLNNPIRSGYRFMGWRQTGQTATELVVKIPSGSMGVREYTAVWEEEKKADPTQTPEVTDKPSGPTPTPEVTNTPSAPTPTPEETEQPGTPEPTEKPKETTQPGTATQAPGASDKPPGQTPTPGVTNTPSVSTPTPEETPTSGISTAQPGGEGLSILLAVGKQKGKNGIRLTWLPYKGTDGYEVYWSYCDGKINFKKLGTVKASGKRAFVHKKLKKNRAYKYYITAYKMIDGKKVYIAKSPLVHVAMKYEKHTNVKNVIVNKTKVTLKCNKSFRVRAKTVLWDRTKEGINHAPYPLRYYTNDNQVATVNKGGKITAKGKGTCTVYVIANNGVAKKIKVNVK